MSDHAPDDVAAFMRGWSLEATHPRPADIAALKDVIAPDTPVYLSAVPTRPPQALVESAIAIRRAGFDPVPHLAVRHFPDAETLHGVLDRITADAGVRTVLVIAGDRDRPLGPFAGTLDVIGSGRLRRHGIEEIGIAGYPDGHPRIALPLLDAALNAKLAAAECAGLRVHVVTQFCFDPSRILSWLTRLRGTHASIPIKVGMVGPANIATLLRYAQRCGVQASLRGLSRHANTMRRLLGEARPDDIIKPLADACAGGALGPVAPHFFSFGGIVRTAQWAKAACACRQLVL